MLQVAVPTRLDDVAVGEDDAAGLVDDEPRGVAGARHLGVEGARRQSSAMTDDSISIASSPPASSLAGLSMAGRDLGLRVRLARLGSGGSLRRALGFWGRG